MMRFLSLATLVGVGLAAGAAAYEEKFEGVAPVPVTVRCREPGGWKIDVARVPQAEKGLGELEIRLTADKPSVPPLLSVVIELPQCERPYFWRPGSASVDMPPNWRGKLTSRLSCRMPVYAYFSEDGRNRFTMATDEVKRDVDFWGGLREEGSVLPVGMDFFAAKESPICDYTVHVRFDFRDVFYADSIREASDWTMASAKLTPAAVPDAAFAPLYSSSTSDPASASTATCSGSVTVPAAIPSTARASLGCVLRPARPPCMRTCSSGIRPKRRKMPRATFSTASSARCSIR